MNPFSLLLDRGAICLEWPATLGLDLPPLTLVFELTARQGHGLNIPATPAILLAKKLAAEEIQYSGATSCIGFLNLNEILTALKSYNIKTKTERNPPKT